MGVSVTFDPAAWRAQFPEFAAVLDAAANGYFTMATVLCRNDGTGPASTEDIQTQLLLTLTAHIAWLFSPRTNGLPDSNGAEPAPALVGRISSATEGSVTVSTDAMPANPNAAWYQQTRYGFMYWQMTAPYRTMRYLRGPQRSFEPWPGIGGFPFRGC
jgi:hypothetical protein